MKRFSIGLFALLTFACIEKPETEPLVDPKMEDLVVPDGFNFEVESTEVAVWKVNGLPVGTQLKAEIFTDDVLQVDGIITGEKTEIPITVPIHNQEVKMVLHMNDEKLVKVFTPEDPLVFEVDFFQQNIAGIASEAGESNNNGKGKGNGNGQNNDSDGDGVRDDVDLEPANSEVSQAIYIPALESYNTIGFEDTWPNNGDYDYNDLVVSFNLNKYMDKSNKLSRVETHFKLLAIGAGFDNDFCYSLEVPLGSVNVTVSDPGLNYELHGDSDYTEVRFPSVKSAFGTNAFVNTVEGEQFYEWVEFTVTTTFDPSENINGNSLPYDFFIRINGEEGREVHMAGKHPTGKVNRTYFGSGDDNSQPNNGRLYLNGRNLPWAVMIPEIWEYPAEKVEILEAYPDFADFAQQNGSFPWYSEFHGGQIVRSKLYKKRN